MKDLQYRTFECIPTSPKLPAVGTKTPSIISSEILFLVMRILKDLTGQLWTLTYKLCSGCWSASITVVFRHQLFSSILKLFCPHFYRINDSCRPLSYLIVIGDGQFTVDCRWQSEVSPLLATGCWMRRPDKRAGARLSRTRRLLCHPHIAINTLANTFTNS